MKSYDPKKIEKKWQKEWEKKRLFQASDKSKKPKHYSLMEFPYPSGDGLHTGHVRGYTAMDIISRKRRMQGFEVLFPIGWDAFGLPTENYALKTGKDPRVVTKENTKNFEKQFNKLGMSFDWSREINTTDPKYYKWTQWLFLKFLEKGLAYKAKATINWCPKDKIGLANEEVVDGCCERCGTPVEKREKEQWMLAITKYADRLDKDLDGLDFPERVKAQQKNWIGKSEGWKIKFDDIEIFTTRPETIFGATFIAIAGAKDKFTGRYIENPATKEKIPVWEAEYVMSEVATGAVMGVPAHDARDWEFAKRNNLPIKEVVVPSIIDKRNPPVAGKLSVERRNVHPIVRDPKTGKYLAIKWRHFPWTTFPMGGIEDGEDVVEAARREVKEETGFINLELKKVLPGTVRVEYFAAHKDQNRISLTTAVLFDLTDNTQVEVDEKEKDSHDVIWLDKSKLNYENMTHTEIGEWDRQINSKHGAYEGSGVLINSLKFNNLDSEKAKDEVAKSVGGKKETTFKLRDWIFSRQRYWGEPIPVIHCPECGIVPVPEKDLPVELPKVKNYTPTDTGESPLANIAKWVNVKCPKCGGKAKRETDVMPNWAGSSWYFLRYLDPKNAKEFASKDKLKHWMPVDWYNGGMEHTTLHLLYSRFWNKFLFDIGLVPTSEPYKKRTSHGLILAEGGEKMSKSKGNVVNPDDIVERFGADTLRLYEMFMGPFDQAIAWNEDSLVGPRRFIEKIWNLFSKIELSSTKSSDGLQKTIKKVTEDIESMKFNTAISSMMVLVNEMEKVGAVGKEDYENLLKILSPFAPHVVEELWQSLGHKTSIQLEPWPTYDESKVKNEEIIIAVQVNSRVRASLKVDVKTSKEELEKRALALPEVQKWLNGSTPKRVVVVPSKVVNIVV